MSKHDNYSKIEEIKRYYSDEDYRAAAELADSVDWTRVKNWDALAMMTDVYENAGELENARDMAILAYNRNLGGKKLVYRLTELLINTGELEEAEETFNEYCQMSKNAPDSYILEYHLLRKKQAPDRELIRVLEEFKEAGPDERYMYRLAELYAKNGENEKCAAVCDNIALWFKDGDFAEGAVKLKKRVGGDLSPEQEKLFSSATVKDEDLAKTSKVDFKGQIDPTASDDESSERTVAGAAAAVAGGAAAVGAAGKIKSFVKNVFNDDDFDEEVQDKAQETAKHEIDPEIKKNLSAEVSEELDNESALRGDGVISGEKQIDGQLNMTDWMTDVREKKYGGQSTKEYSKTELERMLEEKDEKSEAYDRLMAEQRKLADESGMPFNEAGAKRKVELQLAVDAARRDLDIRTGKGTAKQESASMAPTAEPAATRPQEETVLSAVLEAAGTEAVRESAGSTSDPSERMLRIESAVLSLMGANLSDKIAKRGKSAPSDVVDAAALLVKYISGEYEGIKNTTTASDIKISDSQDVSETITKEDDITVNKPQEKQENKERGKEKNKGIMAGVAATAAAGAAATGGVLHEKANKAREIFDKGTDRDAAEADAIKEIKATNAFKKDTMQEAIKESVNEPDVAYEDTAGEIKASVEEAAAPVRSEFEKSTRNTGKTPDLSKMRLNKVTAQDVEANLTDDEAELAKRIVSDDHAVDVITKRITAPISTAEVEKAIMESEKGEDRFGDAAFADTDTAFIDKKMLREIIESTDGEDDAEGKNTRRFDTTAKQDTAQLDNVLREDLSKGKREKIKSMFDEYYDMPEIDAQIEEYIAALPTEITREDSRNGNIIIAGADSIDKTALAKTIAKAVNISYPKKKKKVIKTTGESLNEYGFAKSADKLKGTFLVIEKAGMLRQDIIAEIVDVMSKDTDRMIVIAEDTDAGIESFINSNPALPKLFNHRINMRPFTTEELVEIAKELAGQKGFEISEEGALALYLEIDEIKASEPKVTIDDMDALTDDAIAHAVKRIKKESGVNVKKQGGELSVLTNEDFRY